MTTLLVTHSSSLAHDMGEGHPERPERVRAIERVLERESFSLLARQQAPLGTVEAILRAHPDSHIQRLESASPAQGHARLDEDTVMNPHTWNAALHAVGGAVMAVDAIMRREAGNAFVAMRPPGHHAERVTPMGFCFFNNAAIAARHAQAIYGIERVAIMDFDVHHGNGTQDIFWNDPNVLYASTHQMPLYPGTGALSESGGHGQIVNAPLRSGDDGIAFREAMEEAILPRIMDFSPDLVIISAGFDAHWRDPLANLYLTEDDFGWATLQLMEVAHKKSGGRLVSLLEGGYDLQGLAQSVAVHVAALMRGSLA